MLAGTTPRAPTLSARSNTANSDGAIGRDMLRSLTLELSGGEAVRLNDWLGICGPSATRRTAPRRAKPTSHKPHALKLDGLPQTPNRIAETKHYTTTCCRTKPTWLNNSTSKGLTLELSGGGAVRLERIVRPHGRDAFREIAQPCL